MPDINDKIVSAPVAEWRYEKPKHNGKMLLLTIGGVLVTGVWRGDLGENYLAWAPLLKRDRAKEAEISQISAERLSKRRKYQRDLTQTALELANE